MHFFISILQNDNRNTDFDSNDSAQQKDDSDKI
jgi:hypothetical protein